MSQMLSFNLALPTDMMEDLAMNVHGVESLSGLSSAGVLGMVEDIITIGLEEHLGEGDDFIVTPVQAQNFRIQIAYSALSDVAINVKNLDSLEGLGSADLSDIMGEIVSAGLDELLGYSEGFSVVAV